MRAAVLSLFCLLFVGLVGWRVAEKLKESAAEGKRPGRPAVAVEIAAVTRGEIRDLRVFTGTLLPRARYVVAPKVGGRIEALAVNIGDSVTPGMKIAALDDAEYVQQVAQARATLDVAKATVAQQATALELAKRELERGRSLREKKVSSEAEWETTQAEYEVAAARHQVALAQMAEKESALRGAEVRFDYTRIQAPAEAEGGRWFVEDRYVDEGTMLAANAPIVSVVELSRLVAVISAIERDYPSLRVGMPVEIETDAFPGRSFAGSIVRIAPVLREASRQARVEIEVPNGELLLRPGMFVRARIEFARHPDATLVPRDALVQRDGKLAVFLLDASKPEGPAARLVAVTLGIQSPERVEIAEPALTGEVIVLGQHLLADAASVILPEAEAAKPGETTRATAAPK